jgi:glycosyltransferase involved in cell wall biosynthesis
MSPVDRAQDRRKTVVLVAPYSPELAMLNLGASKKIQLIAKLLDRLGFDIHYVDSAHPYERFVSPIMGQPAEIEGTAVTLWRPFCLPSRKAGKLLNIFGSGGLFRRLAGLQPDLVWVYNSYAFEARLGLFLQKATGARLVFELEDLPLSRGRGLNPKPFLDQHYFAPLLAKADLVTFVNDVLLNRHRAEVQQGLLFPSILQQALVDHPLPERFARLPRRVGYFGGLEVDKGVDVLLQLPPLMPPDWTLVITGVGTLTPDLQALGKRYPGQVEFHGAVSHERVRELMMGCDAILNPHASIAGMHDGVFPFKVCEALATGALLISTPLPSIGLDLDSCVLYFDGSAPGLAQALTQATAHHAQRQDAIRHVRDQVCAQYGENQVLAQLKGAIDALARQQGEASTAATSPSTPHRST